MLNNFQAFHEVPKLYDLLEKLESSSQCTFDFAFVPTNQREKVHGELIIFC